MPIPTTDKHKTLAMIRDSKDLRDAINNLSESTKAKMQIIKKAKALGLTENLPEEWKAAENAGKFRYWMTVEKTINQNGEIFVQGVATGPKVDADNEKMSDSVIRNFFNAIKEKSQTNNPLPLTDGHPKGGGILAEIGEIVDAQILPNKDLFIKARLDANHPSTNVLTDRIAKGKKYAFSIEGWLNAPRRTVFVKGSNQSVQEYTDLVPKSISITTEPSYLPSFLEVVKKAAKNYEELNTITTVDLYTMFKQIMGFDLTTYKSRRYNNLLISKNNMGKTSVSANPQAFESATTVVNAVGTSQEGDATKTDLEVNTQENTTIDTSTDNSDKLEMISAVLESMGYKVTKTDELEPDDQQGISAENPAASALKANSAQDIDNPAFEDLKGTQKSIDAKLDLVTKSIKDQDSKISELVSRIEATQLSMHKDLETLKEMPLAKKSKIVTKSATFNDRAELADPFIDQYRSLKEDGRV